MLDPFAHRPPSYHKPEQELIGYHGAITMSGDRSRLLKVGEYVYWEGSKADRGKVVEIDWSAVTIRWDNGLTNSICHNDMVNVSLAPVKS